MILLEPLAFSKQSLMSCPTCDLIGFRTPQSLETHSVYPSLLVP